MPRPGRIAVLAVWVAAISACGGRPDKAVEIVVPAGATLSAVADTLAARGVIRGKHRFKLYVRLRGNEREIKAGRYIVPAESSWRETLDLLTRGTVATVPLVIPEGFRLRQMAALIAGIAGLSEEEVMGALAEPGLTERLGVPGPGAEGYLFPDTYHFAQGAPLEAVLAAMAGRYRSMWTPGRRARLDSLKLTEREAVTLASIVQAEARRTEEMPKISSVYHNRLRAGWPLQADPTVLYALGGPRARLLYAAIDSVRDHPYNTYAHRGLPPGPIGAPGEMAIHAALHPADEPFMYFVARPDGSHVFTRTLAEHNRAKAAIRRERNRTAKPSTGGGAGLNGVSSDSANHGRHGEKAGTASPRPE